MSIKNKAIFALEALINKTLQLDPESKQYLDNLEQRTLLLHLQPLDINILFSFAAQNIYLELQEKEQEDKGKIDLIISGNISSFVTYLIDKNTQTATRQGLNINGDIHVAENFQKMFLNLNIDWEEELSKIVGDFATQKISVYAKKAKQHAATSSESLQEMVNEYLYEEAQLLPHTQEAEEFINEVDNIRTNVDRLEARINNLIATKQKQ